MEYEIIRGKENKAFDGCDFVVRLSDDRKNSKIKILQITDTQVIDSMQRRSTSKLREDEIIAWKPENFDGHCGNHIRSLVAQSNPDLIIITGDIIYGSYDDNGSVLDWFCKLMDSFKIPWAPVFGNHDNESLKGVDWQCARLKQSPYCLFERGEVSGNGNYSVGVAIGDNLIRVIHMLDSNGCSDGTDPSIIKEKGIYADQIELVKSNTSKIERAQGKPIPAFMALHIPISCFITAEVSKQYNGELGEFYTLGVDRIAKDGDFGFKLEGFNGIEVGDNFIDFLHSLSIDGVFAGHVHDSCTCIEYEKIKWVLGLKTGQYDYHVPGQLGGTLITLEGEGFAVSHLPTLVQFAPMAGSAGMFTNFFVEDVKTK